MITNNNDLKILQYNFFNDLKEDNENNEDNEDIELNVDKLNKDNIEIDINKENIENSLNSQENITNNKYINNKTRLFEIKKINRVKQLHNTNKNKLIMKSKSKFSKSNVKNIQSITKQLDEINEHINIKRNILRKKRTYWTINEDLA